MTDCPLRPLNGKWNAHKPNNNIHAKHCVTFVDNNIIYKLRFAECEQREQWTECLIGTMGM